MRSIALNLNKLYTIRLHLHWELFLYILHAAPSPCENVKALDVAFLLDRTRSVGPENYRLLKGFVLEIVDSLDIGPDTTHAAFITFAGIAKILNSLNDSTYHSNEAVHNLIWNSPNYLGGRTYIDRALYEADQNIFTLEAGSRPEIPKVLILLTDGRTNRNSTPYENIIPRFQVSIMALEGTGKENVMSRSKQSNSTHATWS